MVHNNKSTIIRVVKLIMDVSEVLKIGKEKKKRRKDLIETLLENIHKRILFHAKNSRSNCEYQIPPVISGLPLFNINDIAIDIYKKLDNEGYIVSAHNSGLIYISWDEKLLERKAAMDSFLIDQEHHKIKNLSQKKFSVDDRFKFLANPNKIKQRKPPSDLDIHVNKILREREQTNKKYKDLLDR